MKKNFKNLSFLLLPALKSLRVSCRALLVFFFFFSTWSLYSSGRTEVPGKEPLLLSCQSGQDLQRHFCGAFERAKEHIFICVYDLSDPEILGALARARQRGIHVEVICDGRHRQNFPADLELPVTWVKKSRRLMHKKIVIIDGREVYVGSANLSRTSMRQHENLMVGIQSKELAQSLMERGRQPLSRRENSPLLAKGWELWQLPEDEGAMERLLDLIGSAKLRLRIAMFTWTEPRLAEAVIAAHERGVEVELCLNHDARGAKGFSVLRRFLEAGIPVRCYGGSALLHHKLLWVDDEILVTGSANWTRSAFQRNDDFFIVLHQLQQEEKLKVQRLWKSCIQRSHTLS